MCGLAGFGSAGIFTADDGQMRYVDFHASAPRAARADMWADIVEGEARDGFGFIVKDNVNELGYQSLCAPATLRGLHETHVNYGRLPWRDVVAPAIDWAADGWTVRPHVAEWWSAPSEMGHASGPERVTVSPGGRRLYCDENGQPKQVGASVRNPDLAELLRRIADGGVDDFYEGDIAKAIVADVAANGGLLTLDDLATYRPIWREPLWGTYRSARIATNHLPGGGPMLLLMLNVLEQFDLSALGHNTVPYIRLVAEVMRRATVDKDRHLADPAFVDAQLDNLLSKDYAAEVAESVRAGERASVERLGATPDASDTTHLSVVDGDGNCVALTHSLGLPSGVVPEGLGFMHNGCMSVFDPRPGNPHSIAPGKARFSSIVPSIVFDGDRPRLVVGAPGGTQIAMGVLQVVLNVLDFGCGMTEAVVRPRFSATSNALDVVNRIPRYVTSALEREGYEVIRSPMSYGIAWVHGILRPADGPPEGGADPACDGMALLVELPDG